MTLNEDLKNRIKQANRHKYLDKQLYKYSQELDGFNKILDDDSLTQEKRRSKMKKWHKLQKNPLFEVKMMDQISEKFHQTNDQE
jgi:hypothetical protein